MSPRMFKDKMAKGLKKGATYKPGSLGYDPKMAHELVDKFFEEVKLGKMYSFSSHVKEVYYPQLKAYPDLDLGGFIDAVIGRFEEETRFFHVWNVPCVLKPLISLMYELGYNNHVLDLRGLDGMQENIITGIAATEEKPFSIVLRLAKNPSWFDACYVAYALDYCTIRIFGSAESVGDRGFHSDYTLEDKVRQVGDSATNCAFRFPNVKDTVHTNKRTSLYSDRYRFKMITEGSYFELSVENSFFIRKNKLLVPDGKGSWKEVRPG